MASSNFQRSPSKVWWAQELDERSPSDWHNRNRNGSPSSHKSQDSGFSDSEISPPLGTVAQSKIQKDNTTNSDTSPKRLFVEQISTNILKEISTTDNVTPKKNFTENVKEKFSMKKTLSKYLIDESVKVKNDQRPYERHNRFTKSLPSTPKNRFRNNNCVLSSSKSTSAAVSPCHSPRLFHSKRLSLFNAGNDDQSIRMDSVPENLQQIENTNTTNDYFNETSNNTNTSPKVNRNLMQYFPKDLNHNLTKDDSVISEMDTTNNSENSEFDLKSITLPLAVKQPSLKSQFNATVPLYYQYHLDKIEIDYTNNTTRSSDSQNSDDNDISGFDTSNDGVTDTDSFSYHNDDDQSDCEKEIESFFPDLLDKMEPPAHTSTPKSNFNKKMCMSPLRKKIIKHKKNNSVFVTIEKFPETNPMLLPQFPPVKCWLNEVEQLYEPECMTMLQGKSIANDLARQVSQVSDALTLPIKDMLHHSRIILKEFNRVKLQIENNTVHHVGPLTQSLVGNITEYVLKNMINSQASSLIDSQQTKDDIQNLLEVSTKLRQAAMLSKLNLEEIYTLLIDLQKMFYATEHNILALQIQLLVNAIEDPSSHLSLRGTLYGITVLALQCERLSELVVRAGGPRALLILCVECKASTIRTMALRTLATVSCTTTAIRQLEKADGVEILADILSDTSRPEPELSEATSVLAQITAPWIEDNHNVKGLSENIDTLITAITDFLVKTKCCQNLLLCAAALANITYMNTQATRSIIENKTISKLLEAVRNRGPRASVFLKEQTATLIANLSDIQEARSYLAESNSGVALLCFLQVYPFDAQDEAQSNAAQRLQQKSAIALSRLCNDVSVAKQIVDLGGVSRLIQLCKDGKERNNSDAVLVACLATLRKIVSNCGNDVMDQKDVIELVEPRLLDSFLAYSAQNESYV